MGKELDKEKLQKRKEKEKRKQQKKRWKRINAKVDRAVWLFAVGICVAYSLLEVREKMQSPEKIG